MNKGYTILPDELIEELGLTTAYILQRIERWADYSKMGYATVSNQQLAKDCGLSIDTIKRVKKDLINKGYIKVISRRNEGKNEASNIMITKKKEEIVSEANKEEQNCRNITPTPIDINLNK